MSTQLSLRDSFERERLRVRERRAAQYTAAKRARAERGIGSVGLPDDVLEEVVLLSCVRTVGRLRAASVEFKDAVEAHEGVLWPTLVEARFPTAMKVAELCRSPPRSSEEWIALYRRQLAFMTNSTEVEAEAAPDASDLSRYVFSLEAFTRTPSSPDTIACPSCTLVQPYFLRCQVCNTALPRRAFNESLVWTWAGHPELVGDSMLKVRVPQPENVVRQMFNTEDHADTHHLRVMVTRVEDGMATQLYEGMVDDCDDELWFYEWNHIPAVCRRAFHGSLHTLLPQIHTLPYYPMIRPYLNMDDETYFELAPCIDTEDDPIDLNVSTFLKILDTCVNFT